MSLSIQQLEPFAMLLSEIFSSSLSLQIFKIFFFSGFPLGFYLAYCVTHAFISYVYFLLQS